MSDLICHIAPLGIKKDWIKEGLLFYDWNYLIVLITPQKRFVEIANSLKNDLIPSFEVTDTRELESKLKKKIEIVSFDQRDLLTFVQEIKTILKKIKDSGYKIYFNATSGLELWKFALYFIGTTELLIDKVYYIPKDSDPKVLIKPLEIYLPIAIPNPLKKVLNLLYDQNVSQKDLKSQLDVSKGLASRYLKKLQELELIQISKNPEKKGRYFDITEKGMWYITQKS